MNDTNDKSDIKLVISEKESQSIFKKFAPKKEPAGLVFSSKYVGYVKGLIFKKYYVLKMVTGDTLGKDSYFVEEWCEEFYKFKNKNDIDEFLKKMKEIAKNKGLLSRFSFESSFGKPI